MFAFACACAGLAVIATVGLLFDDRVLGGAPIWAKPLKFAISGAVYGATWSWLCALIDHRERTVRRVSAVIVGLLSLELVVIVGQVLRGRRSHFNFETLFDAVLYEIMAVSIVAVWCGALVLTVLVLRSDIQDRSRRLAVGFGAVISVVGIALGALMTLPTGEQLDMVNAGRDFHSLGAHTVGAPEGGPGLPLLGWSTIGGDLRIPHFVGMHALQAVLLWHALLARTRWPEAVRSRLVCVGSVGFACLLALLTWQAYRGQSVVAPDGWTLAAYAVLVTGVVLAGVRAIRQPADSPVLATADR